MITQINYSILDEIFVQINTIKKHFQDISHTFFYYVENFFSKLKALNADWGESALWKVIVKL